MNEETALLQLTGDASVQQRFLEMSHLYDAAIREIRTRLEILDREFSILYASNPIHHIDSRLKSPRSILAKLELSGEEKEAAKKDMARMLDYIDRLNELDTTGVEPMSHVFPVNNVFREDVVMNGDDSEDMLKNAPAVKDGSYKVPKTVD